MKRDLQALAANQYDIVIVGGGIYGAAIAWDAASRGLAVALVEKADFAAATSANSLKIIHGGLRYLQHGDLRRMRASIEERSTLMRIAPHLIHPLPVLLPTYGHGLMGREVMSLALLINDIVGFDRNHQLEVQKELPRGRTLSRQECLAIAPGLDSADLTGAALFYDAQVHNSERLILAFLHSAAEAGAQVANYVEAVEFLREGNRATGILARDTLTDAEFEIRARVVVHAGGPWAVRHLHQLTGEPPARTDLAKAVNIVTRPLFDTYAVGIRSQQRYEDRDAVLNKGTRFLFTAPWRGRTLIGTTYTIHPDEPDTLQVTRRDIEDLLDEVNRAYPPAQLCLDDVSFVHGGLVPSNGVGQSNGDVQLTKHHQIVDGARFGMEGLFSLVGVKYTTARQVAAQLVDRIFAHWGQRPVASITARTPIHGGDIDDFAAFKSAERARQRRALYLQAEDLDPLLMTYGSAYTDVLRYLDKICPEQANAATIHTALLTAQIHYSVREEMAQHLSDVIFRRTDLGSAGLPDEALLLHCAHLMGRELGWSTARIWQELDQVSAFFHWRYADVAAVA